MFLQCACSTTFSRRAFVVCASWCLRSCCLRICCTGRNNMQTCNMILAYAFRTLLNTICVHDVACVRLQHPRGRQRGSLPNGAHPRHPNHYESHSFVSTCHEIPHPDDDMVPHSAVLATNIIVTPCGPTKSM